MAMSTTQLTRKKGLIVTEPKDTTGAQKAAHLILNDLEKIIRNLECLEEIHCKEHEEKVINDELDEFRNSLGNIKSVFSNAVESCDNDGMEVYSQLRHKVEPKLNI